MARPKLRFIRQLVMRTDFEGILEETLAAERAGFAAVLVPDHFYLGAAGKPGSGIGESWTTLAGLAAATDRIRLGGAVMCNLFRHPCLTAQTAATLDQVSRGRLELGLGAGWLAEEFGRTGIPFPRAGERIAMLAEALEIILPALEGKTVNFEGKHYRVRDFALLPGCVQAPRPPLHIGGGGDKLLRLAARHAEIVSVMPVAGESGFSREQVIAFTAEWFSERVAFLRGAASERGRDPAAIEVINFVSFTKVCRREADVKQALARVAERFGVGPSEIRQHPLALVGTSSEIAETLEERRDRSGIDSVMLGAIGSESLELFSQEVIPRFAG